MFLHRPFILTLPCWDFRLHEFPCNYISVTLHVNKLKEKKEMPSVQLLYQKRLCDGSRLFCFLVGFFHYCLFSVKLRYFYPQPKRSGTQCKVSLMTALLADQQEWLLPLAALTATGPSSQSEQGSKLIQWEIIFGVGFCLIRALNHVRKLHGNGKVQKKTFSLRGSM